MKNVKRLIAIVALTAFCMPGAMAVQDNKKGKKAKNKGKPAVSMQAGKSRGKAGKSYNVTPRNHGQYIKQLRMASKRLKDMAKGKNRGQRTHSSDTIILEVANNIDLMISRMGRTRGETDMASIDLEFMLQEQQRKLRPLANLSKGDFDVSLGIVLEIGL